MEVRVESVDNTLPDGCYIAVRVGDVQKQTLYDAKKMYRFPEARRFGKVDVFQRIASCDLAWNADQPETRVCKAARVEGGGDSGIRLQVSLSRPAAAQKIGKIEESSAQKDPKAASAKKYLMENDVEGILTGAMRALLKAQPADAPAFLCDYIQRQYGKQPPKEVPKAAPKEAPKEAAASKVATPFPLLKSLGVRGYCQAYVREADTNYFAALHAKFPAGAKAKAAAQAAALAKKPQAPQTTPGARVWSQKPSSGTWLTKRPPRPIQPWNKKPSTATWLQPLDRDDEAEEVKPEKPFWAKCASVGTWCVPNTTGQLEPEDLVDEGPAKEWRHKPSVGTWVTCPKRR
eukprot:TRINITY_DN21351_c0_g1_i1.p1 TRINITY_DN21351_c0_g1~~TRINITY_DN21351_c0_g1_i1.p1  ORF type:complete len:346 (-),score=90.97 TRINITY_DN21351_c0_g1_i1:132-1169(-)